MTWRPCPCKSWGNCRGFDDYELTDIIPCRVQTIYLVKGVVEFVSDDSPGSRRIRPHASFVAVSDLIAEFEFRLSRTGRDGETLVHEVRELGVYEASKLSQAARDALGYIAGRKRKRRSYAQWLADRRYKVINLSQTNGRFERGLLTTAKKVS